MPSAPRAAAGLARLETSPCRRGRRGRPPSPAPRARGRGAGAGRRAGAPASSSSASRSSTRRGVASSTACSGALPASTRLRRRAASAALCAAMPAIHDQNRSGFASRGSPARPHEASPAARREPAARRAGGAPESGASAGRPPPRAARTPGATPRGPAARARSARFRRRRRGGRLGAPPQGRKGLDQGFLRTCLVVGRMGRPKSSRRRSGQCAVERENRHSPDGERCGREADAGAYAGRPPRPRVPFGRRRTSRPLWRALGNRHEIGTFPAKSRRRDRYRVSRAPGCVPGGRWTRALLALSAQPEAHAGAAAPPRTGPHGAQTADEEAPSPHALSRQEAQAAVASAPRGAPASRADRARRSSRRALPRQRSSTSAGTAASSASGIADALRGAIGAAALRAPGSCSSCSAA